MYGLDSIDWTKCIFDGMAAVYEPLIPYIVGTIASVIALGMLKWFLHRVHDFICFEVSAREQRKAHKRIDDTVDFLSSIADFLSNLRSDNKNNK